MKLVSPVPGQVEPEGKVTVRWTVPDNSDSPSALVIFELQQADSKDFASPSVRYQGPDRASVLTGFPEGQFHFRVRSYLDGVAGPWSEPVSVSFDYISMTKVWVLVAVGSLMFILTIGAIGMGHCRAMEKARKVS